jgi:hypothetical protein
MIGVELRVERIALALEVAKCGARGRFVADEVVKSSTVVFHGLGHCP